MHSHPRSEPQAAVSKPFLKWTGGKQRLLSHLLPLLPRRRRLIEPFVGAGSVFLAAGFKECVINDANPDLVAVWAALQSGPKDFIRRSEERFREEYRTKAAYMRVRQEFNEEVDRFERAVRLPYLNRFGFNGLFRVNRQGEFNVPYGAPASVPGFPFDQMASAAERLETTLVLGGDFRRAIELAGFDDVLYCDPPYSPLEGGESHVSYTAAGFDHGNHVALVEACVAAVSRGAVAVISNHDTEATRALYRGWQIHELNAWRSVAARSERRAAVKELVAVLHGGTI
jgi:DNA adenine methylase